MKKRGTLFTAILTGIWGASVCLWAYPGLYDRLFIYQQTRNFEQVAIVLEQLLARGDFSSRRMEEIADMYLEAGQPGKVEQFIKEKRLSMAYIEPVMNGYRRLNDLPNLLRLLLLKQKRFPKNLKLREEIIRIYQTQSEYELAIKQLQEGIRQVPEHLIFYEQLGQSYFQIGNDEQALEIYRRRAQQINDAKHWNELAETYLWKGYFLQGESALLRALELDPSPQRMVRLAIFHTVQNNTQEANSFYLRAADALEEIPRENWEASEQLLALQVYDALEQTEDVLFLLSTMSLYVIPKDKLGFYFYIALRAKAREAIDSIFQLLMLNPAGNFLRIQFDYAFFSRDSEALLAVLKQLEAKGEASQEDWQQLASLYLEQKRPELVSDLLKQGYLPLSYWTVVGNTYFSMQRVAAGLQAHGQRAIALNQISSWKELVQLYFFKKHYAEGLEIYRYQVAQPYNQPELWKELSDFYFWQRMDSQGVETLLQAIELSPKQEWVEQLASRYLQSGQIQKIEQLLDQNFLSSSWQWMERLAGYYEVKKQLEQAESYYQRAIPLHGNDKAGRLALVRFYIRNGKLETALPLMRELQEGHEFSIAERIEALNLYIWTSQTSFAIQTLSVIPIKELPQEQLPLYFDLAIFGGNLPKAQEIMDHWRTRPPPDFLKKEVDFAIFQGKINDATALLEQEIQKKGESVELLNKLYELYESDHDNQNTIKTIEKILLINPNSQEWLARAINYYSFHQEFERANQFFVKLFATNPAPGIRKPLIWSLIEQQKGKDAKNLLEATPAEQWDLEFEQLAIDAGYLMQDFQYLGRYLEVRYKRENKIEDAAALVEIFEILKDIKQELFYVRQLVLREPSFNNQVHYTDVLFRAEQRQQADAELAKLVKTAKTSRELRAVANLAEYLPSPQFAFELYERLLQMPPVHALTLKQYGTLLAEHGDYQQAIDVLERYRSIVPDDTETLILLAGIYPQYGSGEQKQKFFENIVSLYQNKKPLSPRENRLLALGLLHTNQAEQAIQAYRDLVRQFPENSDIAQQFMDLLYQAKQYKVILEELQEYSVIQRTETYYQFKSAAQGALNQRDEAIATLNEWVQHFPKNEQAWIDLGYMYQAIGDRDQAFDAFQQARQLAKQKKVP